MPRPRPARWPAAALCAAALGAAPLRAQTGTLRGTVTDDGGRPLPGARVLVVGTPLAAETRDDGTFELRAVPAGTHAVRAQRIGNRFGLQRLAVRAGESV